MRKTTLTPWPTFGGTLKAVGKQVTPPVVWSAARGAYLRVRGKPTRLAREEKGPQYYDEMARAERWRVHYTESHYYFLWNVIADRLQRQGVTSVLEIGCGSGQLAALLYDRGIRRYRGVDFSKEQIAVARKACPKFEFAAADAFQTDLLDSSEYDAVVLTEFLEHLEQDVELLQRVPAGSLVLASVPNYDDPSHVQPEDHRRHHPLAHTAAGLGGRRVDDADDHGGGRMQTVFAIAAGE